jgi:hypothetical protein
MGQSSEDRRGNNASDGLNGARHGRVLVQREVGPRIIVIRHVRKEHVAQMPLAKHDDMIETPPSDRTDQAFTVSILPRRTSGGRLVANAPRAETSFEFVPVNAVSILIYLIPESWLNHLSVFRKDIFGKC